MSSLGLGKQYNFQLNKHTYYKKNMFENKNKYYVKKSTIQLYDMSFPYSMWQTSVTKLLCCFITFTIFYNTPFLYNTKHWTDWKFKISIIYEMAI